VRARSDFASRTLADGVRSYTVRYELWADGATKARFLTAAMRSQRRTVCRTRPAQRTTFPRRLIARAQGRERQWNTLSARGRGTIYRAADGGIPATGTRRRMQLKVGDLTPEATETYQTGVNQKMRHTMPGGFDTGVVPGMPDSSQLYLRMHTRDPIWGMPPIATKVVDEDGATILRNWILSLQ
jgi:hypothetical protein